MEHRDVLSMLVHDLSPETGDQIDLYVEELQKADKQFNLTGLSDKEEIIEKLILGSLSPLGKLNVPRGTKIADMGAGQGIPGIPLSICRPDLDITLIESNVKRIAFLNRMKRLLSGTFMIVEGRIEELGHDHSLRGKYDMVISRAFAPPYVAIECGASLLSNNGLLYIYSEKNEGSLHSVILQHAALVGLSLLAQEEKETLCIPGYGYVFKKTGLTPEVFPRRFAVMKRESGRVEGIS